MPATLDHLSRYIPTVLVLGPQVQHTAGLPDLLIGKHLLRRDAPLAAARQYDWIAGVDRQLKSLMEGRRERSVSVLDLMCASPESCLVFHGQHGRE